MAQDLTELESQRLHMAAALAVGQVQQRFSEVLGDGAGVYQGAATSLGTGWEYDEDGNVIEPPEGGYWQAGMAVGSAPIRP